MRIWMLAAICVSMMLLAGTTMAQEQRGAIQGIVKDASGAVLPGVTVEARGTALIGVATSVTDGAGVYRFPALPPGVYDITAALQDFVSGRSPNILLGLGQILKVDLALQIAGVTEVVSVTPTSPLIDVKQSAAFTNISSDLIDMLPRDRDFTSIVAIVPGANNESKLAGISIDGASGSENRYVVDGIDTTNLQTGQSGKNLLTDVVDQVQVKSSGYNAEFGGATGGVINVISKSGSNVFRGSADLYFSSDALDGGSRPTLQLNLVDDRIAEYRTYPKDQYTRWEPGFTLGGPIKQNRLWFFTSYIPQIKATDRTVTFLSNQQTGTFHSGETTHYSSTNITAQAGQKTRIKFATSVSPYYQRGQLPVVNGTSNPAVNFPVLGRDQPNSTFSGNVDYLASNKLYLAARGGYFRYNTQDLGVPTQVWHMFTGSNTGFADIPDSLKRASGFSDVPTNSAISRDIQSRLSLNADATYYGSFAGEHTFKGGVQMDHLTNDVLSAQQNARIILYWDRTLTTLDGRRVRGTYGYYAARDRNASGSVRSNDLGLFVQDAWAVNKRLTLNLGLRTEKEEVPSFTTAHGENPVAIAFGFKDKLAPRLGFAWDAHGDGRSKVYGSWGVFYDIMKLQLPRGSFGGEKDVYRYYSLDTFDWPSLGGGACPPTCPGTFLDVVDGRIPANNPAHSLLEPNLNPMKSEEFTVGLDHEIGPHTSVGVRYVHKWLVYAIEDVGVIVPGGNEEFISNPGFGVAQYTIGTNFPAQPKATRDYDGLEFRASRRLANSWWFNASYLWSRLNGNYSGLASSDENGRASPNVDGYFDEIIQSFDQRAQPVFGPLPTDRPHQLKVQALYQFPFGTSVALREFASSGTPVSRQVDMQIIQGRVQYLGRLSDGRTPVFSQMDLYVQHEFKLRSKARLQLSLNVLNLFDQKSATDLFNAETRDLIAITNDAFFKGFDVQQLIAAQGIRRDPRFLMDSTYQNPRTARLGVSFLF